MKTIKDKIKERIQTLNYLQDSVPSSAKEHERNILKMLVKKKTNGLEELSSIVTGLLGAANFLSNELTEEICKRQDEDNKEIGTLKTLVGILTDEKDSQ